jgi:hypothetical protein
MRDLLLYLADADAEAFMKSILQRPKALGIREITFDVKRHHNKDSGMVQTGAELTRMLKGKYRKALLMWDHHGSGRDHRQEPHAVAEEIQKKLDSFTWKGHSTVAILIPELEQWLWFCEKTVIAHCDISTDQLAQWIQSLSERLGISPDELKALKPKELFEYVVRDKLRKTISPSDFEKIGKKASVKALENCDSFKRIRTTLTKWFPQ